MTTHTKESNSVPDGSRPVPSLGKLLDHARAPRLVLVDDDDLYREAVATELVENGFIVDSFADGATLIEHLAACANADAIVLDWSLPALPGIDLLLRLRRKGIAVPVVFLTGHSSPAHENMAFDRGALDFVDKTRGVTILAKRLRLIIDSAKRPTTSEGGEILHCGRLMLRPNFSRAYWDNFDVNLTVTEFNIVRLLASNVGNHVTYRAVYDCMHYEGFIAGSGEDGFRTNVRSAIKRIRCKFRSIDPDFAEIDNFASFGYRWGRASVQKVA